jgi:heme/copper-type cytochrome/quinol oxidase subunit 3
MKLLLAYMFVTLVLAMRATRHGRTLPFWPLLIATFVVGAAFLSQRVIG